MDGLRAAYQHKWVGTTFAFILLVIAAIVDAIGVAIFLARSDIAPGGVSGIAVMLNHLDPRLPIGLFILIGNIPIQMLALRMLGGWTVVVRTVFYLAVYAAAIEIIKPLVAGIDVGNNTLTNALFGGVLVGIAGGIVIRAGATPGGTSTLGRILQRRFGLPLSTTTLYTDTGVVFLAGLVFGWEGALYAIISLFVSGAAADYVLEGPSVIRTATIITDVPDEISERVLAEMGRGVTAWQGKGMFTAQEHTVLFVTVSRSQIGTLRHLVQQIDADAFMVVGHGHVAYGHGFRRIKGRLQES